VRRMNFLAAGAAFVFFPLTAFAQDLTPDSTRYLSDPNFLPYAGQIYGYTDYTHTWTNGDSFNAANDRTAAFHVNTDTLSQFLSYGIMDDLEVNAAIHYDPDSQRETDHENGTQTNVTSSGFSDPSFGLDWRALDERSYPVTLDLFGAYTPNWIDSNSPSPNADGTIARGGDLGTVGAALGYETHQFSVRGAFNANIYGRSDTFDLMNGDTLHTDGYTDYVLSLMTQTRLDPMFSVNAGIDHTFASHQNDFNTATDVSHLSEPGDTTALHAALNYNLVPDTAVISATYTHDFYGNGQSVYALPAFNTSTRSRSGNDVGVRLYYLLP
jgi:hypothetical protein